MKTIIWLDDVRNPEMPMYAGVMKDSWVQIYNSTYFNFDSYDTVWLKDYGEFTDWITKNGLPDAICFDHDLGLGLTGKDAANWLVSYCLDNQKVLPLFASQSSNMVGRKNILELLKNFKDKAQ